MDATAAPTVPTPDKRIARGVVKARAKNAHSIRITISEDIAAALGIRDGSYVNVGLEYDRDAGIIQIIKAVGDMPGDVQTYRPKRSKQTYLTLSLKYTDYRPPLEPLELPHEFSSDSLLLDLSALCAKDSASPTLPQGEDHGSRSN